MEQFIRKIKPFKTVFFLIVIFALFIVLQFKQGTIERLREDVAKKPKIEYVYRHTRDTIKGDSIPYPVETIKWKDSIEYVEKERELSEMDSAEIIAAYLAVYQAYKDTTVYQDTLKNDTLAFIQLNEKISENKIADRELIYEDRTPVITITNTLVKQDKTWSLIGGLDGAIGPQFNTISLGAGLVTTSNRVYIIKYDPVNDMFGGSIYLPIFNRKK